MIYKWLEEWFDTILYLVSVFVLLGVFFCFWTGEYRNRYAEMLIRNFLHSASVNGKITYDQYENLVNRITELNSAYHLEISCIEYKTTPVYSKIPREKLTSYYVSRNVREEPEFIIYVPEVEEEEPDSLVLQEKNNVDLLADNYNALPLPSEEKTLEIKAVVPQQKVYEGEELVTLCHIVSGTEEYYLEAMPATAEKSGTVFLELWLSNVKYQIPVQAECYSRIILCENGHEVVNAPYKLTEEKIIKKEFCPYCDVIPQKINCNREVVYKKTGEILSENDICISVVYMNGRTECLTPESKEWQDSYDKNYCGIQHVTVQYRGKSDTCFVVSENGDCVQCNEACNERCHEDYVNFPYCISCMSKTELFSGKTVKEETVLCCEELKSFLEKSAEKNLRQGDFIRILLKNDERHVTFLQEKVKKDGKEVE